jgi:hypothetical protein
MSQILLVLHAMGEIHRPGVTLSCPPKQRSIGRLAERQHKAANVTSQEFCHGHRQAAEKCGKKAEFGWAGAVYPGATNPPLSRRRPNQPDVLLELRPQSTDCQLGENGVGEKTGGRKRGRGENGVGSHFANETRPNPVRHAICASHSGVFRLVGVGLRWQPASRMIGPDTGRTRGHPSTLGILACKTGIVTHNGGFPPITPITLLLDVPLLLPWAAASNLPPSWQSGFLTFVNQLRLVLQLPWGECKQIEPLQSRLGQRYMDTSPLIDSRLCLCVTRIFRSICQLCCCACSYSFKRPRKNE